MADRQFTWEAIIDNKGAIRSINELTDTLKRAFQQSGTKVELIDKASVEAAKASIRSATTEQVESQKRATIEARTQSSERVQLARNESALVAEAAKAASATKIEEERRTTALLRAELQERQRAISLSNQQSSPQAPAAGGGGNGLQNAVLGGIAGYFTVQGAQQIFNYAKEIAALDTSVSRASKAFEIMSGSANEAEKRLRAIQSASGGTVTEFQAIQIANQATSLGLAKSSGEFEKLTRAARAVTFVSPVIHDVQSAISELALASSNLSFRRLDQLGLSVTEVKTRMSELKAMNSGLDDSQAFLAASVDALNSKFGALLNSTEAQAGGVERLSTAWENFKAAIATGNIGEMINKELTDAAFAIEKFQAFLTGDTSKLGTADKLDFLIAGKKTQLTGASDGGAEYQAQIADLERLKTLLDEVDRLSAAGVPGLDSFTERLRIMAGESVAAGHVTEDAAASMGYLQAALASAEGALDSTTRAGTYYAKAVEIAGAETINTDERTSALLGRMVNLTIQYDMGAISAAEYTAYVGELGSQLIDVAEQAATAANEVGRLNNEIRGGGGYANPQKGKYNRVDTGATYKPEIFDTIGVRQKNQEAYDNLSSSDHGTKDDARVRSLNTSRANAKELEVAARKAASAGTKAFNTAAREMNSMITGIVKVSEVTQQDIEDAKNGTYKEKPDEYLRQLRDEVKNKKDYKDVSIEEAAAGLNKIGIETAGKSAEAVLQLFEQAYSNMSLFADESNLKFINDAAVQYQIDLQEKSKLGQENIVRHFGGIVDGAVSAIVGGGGGGASTGVAGGVAATGAAPAINIDGQALAGNNLDIKATVTGLEIGTDVDTDLSDKFSFKLTINQQSIVLTADDAQLIKDRIAGQITPKLTFNQQSIVFTADDAQIVRDRLASQMTPKINLSGEGVISADPKVMETIRGNLGKLLTPKIWVTDEGGINADPVKIETIKTNLGDALTPTINPIIEVTQQEQDLARVKIEQSIMPTLRPILGDPTQQEIVAYQQRLDSLVKEKPAATLAGQGGLGNLLVRNGKETGEEKNPLAGDYIASLTDSFNTPENVLALATIGTGIRGAIDSGIRTAPTGDVGTEIIALINGQFFSEANVITIKSIGNNVFELIIAGIRLAMQKKTNNVGQEIVSTIAAQVVSATADAISGE